MLSVKDHWINLNGLRIHCLAGYSLGGWISLHFTLAEPPRVQKLVLVDSAGLAKEVPWRYLAWGLAKTPWLHQNLRKYYMHSGRLDRVTAPCLIVHGEEDPLIPVEAARRAHRLMRNSLLFVLPGCGHWPQKEKPEEFMRILNPFLRDGSC